jgi:glutathione synthase/RimK-type ligase-like ATP-grasp enzyme
MMTIPADRPIAIFYEHPDWFKPLFAELERRKVAFVQIDANAHSYDPAETESPYSLVFNRASPSAYLRSEAESTFHTLNWIRHLERLGIPVVNGSAVYSVEISKAFQLDVLEELGLPYPRSRVINNASVAAEAAKGLRFPVVIKANIGGSGAGITRYDSIDELERAAEKHSITLGIDHTSLVQELVPYTDGHITRVETISGKFVYAINVYPAEDSFNLCPADACQTTEGVTLTRSACALDAPKNGMRVEGFTPPREIIEQAERIAQHVQLDVGGIEYMIDQRDGKHYFYDINALSNFVADARNVIGFDPFERLVDYLVVRAGISSGTTKSQTSSTTAERASHEAEPVGVTG